LCNYVLCWLPGCSLIQHGWSHLGGDRYNYFPLAYSLPGLILSIYTFARQEHFNNKHFAYHKRRFMLKRNILLFLLLGWMYSLANISQTMLITWQNDDTLLSHCMQSDQYDWECAQFLGDYYGAHQQDWSQAAHYSAIAINDIAHLTVSSSSSSSSSVSKPIGTSSSSGLCNNNEMIINEFVILVQTTLIHKLYPTSPITSPFMNLVQTSTTSSSSSCANKHSNYDLISPSSPRLLMFQATIFYRYQNIASACHYSVKTALVYLFLHIQQEQQQRKQEGEEVFGSFLPDHFIQEIVQFMQEYHQNNGNNGNGNGSNNDDIYYQRMLTIELQLWQYFFTSKTILSFILPELLPMFVNNYGMYHYLFLLLCCELTCCDDSNLYIY